jgi:hypothetical protein
MKKMTITLIAISLSLYASCAKNAKTTLGDLVRVEKKEQVVTDESGTIKAKAGEILYLLNFEGKKEIRCGPDSKSGSLVDSTGREYLPVFMGSPKDDGTLANKEWLFSGTMTAIEDGKFTFAGTATLPEPKAVFVYAVPKNASGLGLKDGDQTYPVS